VEGRGRRQLLGKVRAADGWSGASARLPYVSEGWGMSGRQQAVADCRVDRAQPTNRASGVRCTPWLGPT